MSIRSNEKAITAAPRRVLDPATLLLYSVVLFGMAARADKSAALAALVATVLVGATLVIDRRSPPGYTIPDDSRHEKRLLAAVLIFALLGALGLVPSAIGPTNGELERLPGLAWAILAICLFVARRRSDRKFVQWTVVSFTIVLTLVVGALHLRAVEGLGLDVHFLHVGAANALANGENPYTDAVVVPNGAPTAEPDDVITGYPYPPVAAVSYSIGEWVFSDPRYTSLAAWVVVLGLIGGSAIRTRSRETLYLMLLLATIPGWPNVLRAASTEPLSLALVTAAFLTWRRSKLSGFALGLGLASKQYFLVAAPIALLHRDEGWKRRLAIVIATAGVAVGLPLLIDFSAFWSAAVEFHSTTPPRVDSSNFVGILSSLGFDWTPPTALSLGAGLVVATALGRLSHSRNTLVLAVAAALGTSFMVSSQAFGNYWFLVAGLCVLGLIRIRAKPVGPVASD